MKTEYKNLPVSNLSEVIKSKYNLNEFIDKTSLTITIFGFFGMRNIGDDAILTTEIQQLRQLSIPLHIYVPSRYPENVKKFNVIGFRFGNIPMLIQVLLKSDVIIVGGGGLFCNPWKNLSRKVLFTDLMFTIYKTFFFLVLPKILRKVLVIYGIGYYSNQNPLSIKLTSYGLKHADYISVRDRHSYEFLKKILHPKQVHFFKDVAFSLQTNKKMDKNLIGNLNLNENNRIKRLKIGISLIIINDKKALENILQAISLLIMKYSKQTDFYLFPFYVNPEEENDLTIINSLKGKIIDLSNIFIINNDLGPKIFFDLFKHLDAAICMRFHAQVFAYIQKVPFLGISYDKKCESFLKDINNEFLDITNINFKSINTKYNKLLKQTRYKEF